jgi:hypothetical protein
MPKVKWLDKPEDHDSPAAADYLALVTDRTTIRSAAPDPRTRRPRGPRKPPTSASGRPDADDDHKESHD